VASVTGCAGLLACRGTYLTSAHAEMRALPPGRVTERGSVGIEGGHGLSRTPRSAQWLLLTVMTFTFLGQVLSGFGRPANIVVACLSGVVALWLAVALWLGRRRRSRQ
jgi:hypothetical protein